MEEIPYFCLLKNCQNLNDYYSKLRFLLLNIQKFITGSIFGFFSAGQRAFCSVVSLETGDAIS